MREGAKERGGGLAGRGEGDLNGAGEWMHAYNLLVLQVGQQLHSNLMLGFHKPLPISKTELKNTETECY